MLPDAALVRTCTWMQYMTTSFSVRTKSRTSLVDITGEVQEAATELGIEDGAVVVYVPHTTAAVTVNESADPDVARDLGDTLSKLVPASAGYRHAEGNSDGHVKSSLVGCSEIVLVEDGRLVLGTWQGIFFCEFDGPRARRVIVGAL
jgi:secondary thiamine-phosphate synthase enzyme